MNSFGDGKPGVFDSVAPFLPSAAESGEYAGNYVSEEIEPIYRVAVQDGKLVLMRLKRDPDTLEPRTRDVFSGAVGTIRFTRDSNNHVSGFLSARGVSAISDSCAKHSEIKCSLAKKQLLD